MKCVALGKQLQNYTWQLVWSQCRRDTGIQSSGPYPIPNLSLCIKKQKLRFYNETKFSETEIASPWTATRILRLNPEISLYYKNNGCTTIFYRFGYICKIAKHSMENILVNTQKTDAGPSITAEDQDQKA